MTELLFFSVANEAYEPFVLPYAVSALRHNPEAMVEIVLQRPRRFEAENADALDILRQHFGEKLVLSRSEFGRMPANSLRFLIEPRTKAATVYIGDIDIIITEDIRPGHEAHMVKSGLPYSNIRRGGKRAMTGLHYTRWDAFYPIPPLPAHTKVNLDEGLLFDLVEVRGQGLPRENDNYRPIHGIHLSLNRDPRVLKGSWGGINSFVEISKYLALAQSDVWSDIVPHFDIRYRRLLTVFETAMVLLYRESLTDFVPTKGTLVRDWW